MTEAPSCRDSGTELMTVFSLFSIVNFQNAPCTSSSSISGGSTAYRNGTCFTSSECSDKGGTIKGSCAAGFGACCVFILDSKDSTTINYNDTYIQNPGYPNTFSDTTSLSYTINKCDTDVCFFRMDFEQFTLKGPADSIETNGGVCTDTMTVTVNSGQKIPTICGQNTGQHIYVAVGNGASDSATLALAFSGDSSIRQWEIKVSQIPCGAWAPPDGCLQWNTGLTGRLTSFNWLDTGSSHLADQQYTQCVRQEAGYCCIEYQVCSGSGDTDPFTLSVLSTAASMAKAMYDSDCSLDYISIPASSGTCTSTNIDSHTKYCGETLSTMDENLLNTPVCDCTPPFRVGIKTDNTADTGSTAAASATTGIKSRGLCLEYMQKPC